MRLRYRSLLTATTGTAFVLILLGVYTAGAGAGLTCAARWPFCDGYLGLFPADWLSFVEWFHRLVAMVTGFMILGSVALAWRQGRDRRGAWYLSGALVLLPLQIALGALTVTLNGLLPWGYSVPVHAAHFSTGLTIFTLLGLTTARAWRGALAPRLRALAVAALALVPVQYLFSFGTVLPYSAEVQGAYYGLSLGIFTLVLAGAVGAASAGDRRLRSLFSGGAVLMAVEMVLGRQYLAAFPQVANDLLSVATLAVLAVTVWAASQRADEPAASPYPQTDD